MNHISFNNNNKNLFFKIQIPKKLIKFLLIFKKYNLISNFMVIRSTKDRIFALISPSFNRKLSLNFFFKFFFLPTRRFQITIKALHLLKNRTGDSVYLISSSLGILDHFEAILYKKSGFLFGMIHS